MSEASAEQYRDRLVSFITPNLGKPDKIAWIGEVISIHGYVFRLNPCDYNRPHERLCAATRWFDVRNVIDLKIVGVVSRRTAKQ